MVRVWFICKLKFHQLANKLCGYDNVEGLDTNVLILMYSVLRFTQQISILQNDSHRNVIEWTLTLITLFFYVNPGIPRTPKVI